MDAHLSPPSAGISYRDGWLSTLNHFELNKSNGLFATSLVWKLGWRPTKCSVKTIRSWLRFKNPPICTEFHLRIDAIAMRGVSVFLGIRRRHSAFTTTFGVFYFISQLSAILFLPATIPRPNFLVLTKLSNFRPSRVLVQPPLPHAFRPLLVCVRVSGKYF